MFGWFSSSDCPADFAAKSWIEEQLEWLSDQFRDWLHEHPVIEPTPKFFPDEYDRSPRSVRMMLDRVCRYMDVAPRRVTLELYSESRRPVFVTESGDEIGGTAGTYEERGHRCHIRLEQQQLERPMDLVGTLAHELSHERLMGENRIDPDRFDNELLTDLTATYLGFGVFLANCPRDWKSGYSTWPAAPHLTRPEYMSLPMYGYSLALIARERCEDDPPWAKHLRRDARSVFRQSMRCLTKRG